MSASLVGSENVYKRQPRSVPRGWPAAWPAAVALRRRQGAQASAWPTRIPVSYTHLTLPTICSV
eukprot:1308844-Alexandrium_andersonii.AAC.1